MISTVVKISETENQNVFEDNNKRIYETLKEKYNDRFFIDYFKKYQELVKSHNMRGGKRNNAKEKHEGESNTGRVET